jgi:hypothetical protein
MPEMPAGTALIYARYLRPIDLMNLTNIVGEHDNDMGYQMPEMVPRHDNRLSMYGLGSQSLDQNCGLSRRNVHKVASQ